jgi:hypothetical protein
MLTPSGRFQPDKRICFSMSDFHPGTVRASALPLWFPTLNTCHMIVESCLERGHDLDRFTLVHVVR